MENKYTSLCDKAKTINSISDLYDLVIGSDIGDPCILVSMKTQYAHHIIYRTSELENQLNIEHLSRKGILFTEDDDLGAFRDDHFDDWIFDSVTARYCETLDTYEHPIPAMLRFMFNDKRIWKNDFALDESYCEVLNTLAQADNQKLFDSLTPDVISSYQRENKPILFHSIDSDFFVDGAYYLPYYYNEISVPKSNVYEDVINAIKNELIDHDLLPGITKT